MAKICELIYVVSKSEGQTIEGDVGTPIDMCFTIGKHDAYECALTIAENGVVLFDDPLRNKIYCNKPLRIEGDKLVIEKE